MKISGKYTLDATRQEVWDALNDIHVLARVVPGCERLDQTGENEYEGTVKIGIQSIKGTYSGRIRIEDIQPPTHYKLIANGKSANGVVDGSGTVDLEEQDDKTLLTYGGDAQIGGVLASVGQRLIEGASRQLINQSLKALAEQIAQRRTSTSNGSSASTEAPVAKPNASLTQMATQQPMPEQHNAPASPVAASAAAQSSEEVPITPALFPGTEATPAAAPVSGTQAAAKPNASLTQMASQPPMPEQNTAPATAYRSVVVPEHEQLKPESIVSGMLSDMYNERPWIIWVALAAVLGYLLGRARSQ